MVTDQLGPWTAQPEADNSAHRYQTTQPVDTIIVFAHADVTPQGQVGPPYWITNSGL